MRLRTAQSRSKTGAMVSASSLASFARLLADSSRVSICLALLDGRAWTVNELAGHVGIGRSTASEHITLLVDSGLLAGVRQGRHRYVRLSGFEHAQFIEELASAHGELQMTTSLLAVRASAELRVGRTCYDHLAGALGVTLWERLISQGYVDTVNGLSVTPTGRDWIKATIGDEILSRSRTRPLLRVCLDWTERRDHLGGALGAALHRHAVEQEWITISPRHRAVTTTAKGAYVLSDISKAMPTDDGVAALSPGGSRRASVEPK